MVNLTISLSWLDKDPFKGFKMKKKKVEKEFLNEWELDSIEKKTFDIDRLAIVRDMFVFCCYTGLAYVDMSYRNATGSGIVGQTQHFLLPLMEPEALFSIPLAGAHWNC